MEPKDLKKMNSIQHLLHSQHHLILFKGTDLPWYFICNGCREVKSAACDAAFGCKKCEFYLDLKCAALMGDFFSNCDRQRYKEMEKKANKPHLSHTKHGLKLGHLMESAVIRSCSFCRRDISGYVYCCLDCDFFIHERCLNGIKKQVIHPFHPEHPLRLTTLPEYELKNCRACRGYIKFPDMCLSCEKCGFNLHYSCAREPFPRPLNLPDFHKHSPFYFRDDAAVHDFKCELCSAKHEQGSVYRCVECSWAKSGSFHLACVSPPYKVKHESHTCDLTLSDSVKGHDSANYCCDICKNVGDTKDHVYSCDECNYIAHTECVLRGKN